MPCRCFAVIDAFLYVRIEGLIIYHLQYPIAYSGIFIFEKVLHYIRVIQKYDNFIRTTEYKFIIRNAESQGDFKSCSSSFHCLVFLINVVLGIQGLRNIYLLRIILNVA